jgi:DNA-binding MarR family transcriptional regulator
MADDMDDNTSDKTARQSVPAGLKQNIGFLLNRTSRLLRDDMGVALQPLMLSVHEYAIMRIVETHQAETQQGVAERYGVDSSTMVEIVDRLEARDILVREKNPLDRRSHRLVLTPKGRKTLTRAKRIGDSVHKKFLSPLEENERELLYSSLAKLISVYSPEK